MTRIKSLFAGLVVTAITAVVPAANAQAVHVAGVGSSAQFLGTMIGMSQLAANNLVSGQCQYHWTRKSALQAHDNRDSLGRIIDETGNVGIVWIAACSDSTGNTNVTDIWLDGQYDSTLGVRLFSAQQKAPTAGAGATLYLVAAQLAGDDNLVSPNSLWADNKGDTSPLPANVSNVFGTASPGNVHVNMGLTDIRPEDALAATNRAKAALNTTTWSGLGYVGPTGQIGAPIYTAQAGSNSNFTPIGFALSGLNDPINSGVPVPAYTTIPVGAAPIVFAYNHTGNSTPLVTNLVSGVKGDGTGNIAGSYKLANLFDGTSSCDTHSTAFGGNGDGLGTAMNIMLREPLSGTMNTTEYSLFRTTGNTMDSQEKGIINPTRAPYNPLNLTCPNAGNRQRRIGTGQVLSAINGTANTLGYFFFSFANSATVNGSAANATNYNYLTIDGVDPIGLSTTNQQLPFCSGVICPASQWAGSISFPSLRNGTYKAWSVYRWTVYNSNSDPLGPAALAESMQDNIDGTVADFVPFVTTTNSDGLEVYRSHFTQSGKAGNNGPASPTETLTNGNSLGGGTEQGGDQGGVIIGWDHSTVTVANGTTGHIGHSKVSKTAGRSFGFSDQDSTHTAAQAAALLAGQTVTIHGNNYVVSSAANEVPTVSTLYLTTLAPKGAGQSFSVYIAPHVPGLLNKHQ
jgi:ABC-type phosphate transport system substrate-binding protein